MNSSKRPSMPALLRAQRSEYLDAARNGGQGARHRTRKPLRLPPDLWDRIGVTAEHFQLAFPDRYITLNSTIEFLLHEALVSIAETSAPSSWVPNEYELCTECGATHHADSDHECE